MASPESAAVKDGPVIDPETGAVLGQMKDGVFIPNEAAVTAAGSSTISSVPVATAKAEIGGTALDRATVKTGAIDGDQAGMIESLSNTSVWVGIAIAAATWLTFKGLVALYKSGRPQS